VPWADVTGIQELELMGQKMVMVMLRDPVAYIERQTNPFKRQLMKTNFNSYGSPINISANALECSYSELLALFTTRLAAHRAGN
ncbi:MAG TPA: STM3941 family protein, partial [Hymenobacter sp.]